MNWSNKVASEGAHLKARSQYSWGGRYALPFALPLLPNPTCSGLISTTDLPRATQCRPDDHRRPMSAPTLPRAGDQLRTSGLAQPAIAACANLTFLPQRAATPRGTPRHLADSPPRCHWSLRPSRSPSRAAPLRCSSPHPLSRNGWELPLRRLRSQSQGTTLSCACPPPAPVGTRACARACCLPRGPYCDL